MNQAKLLYLPICLYCLLLIGEAVYAQDKKVVRRVKNRKDVEILYNWAHSEQNLSLNYAHYFGRHAVFGGIKLHFNTEITANNSRLEEWTFYASDFEDRIGLNLGYKYELLRSELKRIAKPYLFYQLQFPLSLPARRTFTYVDPNDPTIIRRETLETSSFDVFENSFGVGISSSIHKRLLATVSIGTGPVVFFNNGASTSPNPELFTEWSYTFRAGLMYRFGGIRP